MTTEEIQKIKQRFGIIGTNSQLNHAIEVAVQVAKTDLSVLVTGESGTGKEFFPQIIHTSSVRKSGPYFAINCGAIPEGTIDSELFGHEKGAFTDAKLERKGYFEIADGGTLFLDEVGELPLQTQVRLLRVLETGEFIRMGSSQIKKTNVRVVAATNLDMRRAIQEGRFREDLYYRLNTVEIKVPALRERKDDIPLLVDAFVQKHDERLGKEIWMVSDGAMRKLAEYDYPANVRELENIVVQSVAMAEGGHVLTEKLLQMPMTLDRIGPDVEKWGRRGPLNEHLANVEKEIIREALMDCGGNISKAAEMLQIKRQTLQHKLRKYGLKE
jgi:arginine utilization regulatory protein